MTATCSAPDGPRYGAIEIDSNLPDVRISLGGPEGNAFTAAVLRTDPAAAAALDARLASRGTARVWVPASQSRAAAFAPGADLRGPRDLPVLIIAGADLDGAVSAVIDDLADAQIEVEAAGSAVAEPLQPAGRPGGRAGNGARRAHRRAAEPRHAEQPGDAGGHADHRADAGLQQLAVRRLDRRRAADRPGRQQLRLAALESYVRVRARRRSR